ncbi:MAG: right-handed parallel beta-helix repeat-containing protein [Acidimicrobiia bacterium]
MLLAAAVALLAAGTVLVGPAGAATLGCGDVITEDTTLTADVGPCAGTGLVVAADGVTLDLGGHTVMGDAEARSAGEELGPTGRDRAGIVLRQVSDVVVANGTVTGFDAGVAIVGGGGNTVRRVTARDNVNYRLVTGRDARPTDVDPAEGPFCWFGEGIVAFHSVDNLIEHNLLVGNGPFSGVSLVGQSDDNVVSANRVHDNDLLNVSPQGDTTICGGIGGQLQPQPMTAGRRVQGIGIRVEGPGAERNLVAGNHVVRAGLAGIMVHGHNARAGAPANSHTVIRHNRVFETGVVGHGMERQLHGIMLHHSGASAVNAPHSTLIEGNTSSFNLGGGIFLDSRGGMHSTVVRNNTMNHNGLDGLHVAGPGDPRGEPNLLVDNRAHHNGRRAQEVNEGPDRNANYAGTDGADMSDGCVRNTWSRNRFGTVNQPCVAAGGTGSLDGPGNSAAARPDDAGPPLGRGPGNGHLADVSPGG